MTQDEQIKSITRIPARWVQVIIPPLNSFSFLKVHRTKKIIFLLYFTIEVCIQAQTRASRDLTDFTIDQTRVAARASETFNFAWHSSDNSDKYSTCIDVHIHEIK